MVSELNFEKDFIIKYFVDDLDYQQIEPSLFNSDLMLIPSTLEKFIYNNYPQLIKEIIKEDFKKDEKEFLKKFMQEASDYLYSNHNVAIQLNPKSHSSFRFLNKYTINLYIPFEGNNQNIYNVIEQPTFKINSFIVKPDIGIFINGILVSFMQLKLQHRNQCAAQEGRGQIIGDYLETITRNIVDQEDIDKLVIKNLKYFHSPIHLVTMDISSSYIIRGIKKYFDGALKISNQADNSSLKEELLKNFYLDTIYTKDTSVELEIKAKKSLFNLYNKEALQNEILYYNFLAYEKISERERGQKTVRNKVNTPILSFPRPNQKYGVDKTIKEIIEKYKNESSSNYEISKLETKLNSLRITDKLKTQVLEKRKVYKNNHNQFSILLQYAAGFGKTYILCWLSLLLKDQKDSDGNYLFNKIILVSDRVDLRDQIDLAMQNMNIEKSLFGEAQDRGTLKKYLTNNTPRVIIVNIQKFPFLKDMLGEEEKALLKDKRVAFLIDEIHRSNSGLQHGEMTNLFDEITDSFNNEEQDKKNLVVGLTATPTDENLARFGEYDGCLEDIKWVPFDSYTMREAISDGFILNPLKGLIPCSIELQFQEEEGRFPSNKNIYENSERIDVIANKVVKIILDTTFKQVGGYGKAMLACSSIVAAKKYYDAISRILKKLTTEPKYNRFIEAKAYLVYSQNQEDTPAHIITGYGSEKDIISNFRSDKNGIMIVVDKLQTGFDEPRLHTLFLDKEVKDINAVQTVCRVNRTAKNKFDCLVVDFSIDNRNIENIKSAFKKYSDTVASTLDSFGLKQSIEENYKKIINTDYFSNYYQNFKKDMGSVNEAFSRQTYIETLLKTKPGEELINNTCELFLVYLKNLNLIENIIGIEEKYKENIFVLFLKEFINLTRNNLKRSKNNQEKEIIDYWVEDIGLIEISDIDTDVKEKLYQPKKSDNQNKKTEKYDILDLIKNRNKKELEKEFLMQEYLNKLIILFEKILEIDSSDKNNGRLLVKIKDFSNYTEIEIEQDFSRIYNMAERRLKNIDNMKNFMSEIEDQKQIILSDFCAYIESEKK